MAKTYDPRCYDLAEVFLEDRRNEPDYEKQAHDLACDIQGAVEDWLFMNPSAIERTEEAANKEKA